MNEYTDFYGKTLCLDDKVLYARNDRIMEGKVDKIYGNKIVVMSKDRWRTDIYSPYSSVIKID